MSTICVVGLGIGSVYVEQASARGHVVYTVDADPAKKANYTSMEQAVDELNKIGKIDATVICLPNYLHREGIERFAPNSRVVVVEKPGLRSEAEWRECVRTFHDTQIRMVRNNFYRPQTNFLSGIDRDQLSSVEMVWSNKNRIPFPGGWFTDSARAWGGVSRDLMPHLVHFCLGIFGNKGLTIDSARSKRWQAQTLQSVAKTDYGTINRDGVFDVDDNAVLTFRYNSFSVDMLASWQSTLGDQQTLTFNYLDGTKLDYKFGLCPNYVYGNMLERFIQDAQSGDKSVYEEAVEFDSFVVSVLDGISKV